MTNIFPHEDFDDWADTYDASIAIDGFPFYGYQEALEKTVALADSRPGMTLLDLGTGTGNLALHFGRLGCELWCTDFSEPMLAKARLKLPLAQFCLQDLRSAWPADLPLRFDRIVSAYVFHHFELEEKIRIVRDLVQEHLISGGRLVIADVAFPNRSAQERLKKKLGGEWEDEYYWIADESIPILEKAGLKVKYVQVSSFAGVFSLQS